MSFLLKIGKKCSDITLGKILLTRYAKNYQTFPRMWTKDEEVVSNCKAYAHIRSNQILMIPECATCVTNMYSSMYPDTYRNVSCTPYITRWLMIWPSFAVNVSICKGLMHFGFLAKKMSLSFAPLFLQDLLNIRLAKSYTLFTLSALVQTICWNIFCTIDEKYKLNHLFDLTSGKKCPRLNLWLENVIHIFFRSFMRKVSV